jgi:O-antigen ligase
MRRAVLAIAGAVLLGGSTALAFFSGGYYAEPRLIAAIVVWALVLALTVLGEAPLPRSAAGRLALGGLALLTAWSALSVTWAPLRGPAIEAVERLVLYTGVLVLALGVLRTRAALRAVEPALAAGATVVIGYGLAGRLLPGLVHLDRSRSAGGRLEQPITYWNAEGALAAVGLVLCARLAADRTRPPAVRIAAAAATVPLGAGVYLSYSRGALAGAVLGLAVLVAAAPTYRQLRASALALAAGAAAAAVTAALPGVAALEGSDPERDGAIALVALVLLAAGAGFLAAPSRAGPDRRLPHSGRLGPAAGFVVTAVAVGLVAAGLGERPTAAELGAGARAGRLTTVSSNRYEYWRIGLAAFERRPLGGVGAAGFRVEWLRERTINEAVRDAHSLEVEVGAELGLPGLVALGMLLCGVGLAARRALRAHAAAAAGPAAALLVWFLHASIDWDWQLPAVSLPAIVLAGALIVLAERPSGTPDVEGIQPALRRERAADVSR